MTKLRAFAHHSEALLAQSLLESHGIRAEILGEVTIIVPPDRLSEAKRVVDELMAKDMMLGRPKERINHFKKGVIYALLAPIVVPGVFNFISLRHAYRYWENSRQETEDQLKVALIVLLNVPTYFILKALIGITGDMTSHMFPDGGNFEP